MFYLFESKLADIIGFFFFFYKQNVRAGKIGRALQVLRAWSVSSAQFFPDLLLEKLKSAVDSKWSFGLLLVNRIWSSLTLFGVPMGQSCLPFFLTSFYVIYSLN